PFQPVNPGLTAALFSGRGSAGIRELYAGSAGGRGYDLAWAVDGNGNSVNLGEIRFIRVDVLSGVSEIDSFVVVPEPGTWVLLGFGGMALAWMVRRKV
ncbi:MAG: PEP-CTERM sorting domain-containing protein, partial [Verrucomicrobiales bacterium]